MSRIFLILSSFILLAACDPARVSTASGPDVAAQEVCAKRGAGRCVFINGPVRLHQQPVKLPSRSALFYPMAADLEFVDGSAAKWQAPEGTLTDGASIPPLFVAMLGDPASREYAPAGAMHDAYCGLGNENGPNYHARPWQQVHRMFYDGLRVAGTPEKRAKLMFAAVWLGGPRWGQWDRGLGDVTGAQKQQMLKQTQALIDGQNPPISDLIGFMSRLEDAAIATARSTVHGGGAADHGYYGSEGGVDPSL